MQNTPQVPNLLGIGSILMQCPYLSIWLGILWTTRDNPAARRRMRIACELMYLPVEDEDWGDPKIIVDPQ